MPTRNEVTTQRPSIVASEFHVLVSMSSSQLLPSTVQIIRLLWRETKFCIILDPMIPVTLGRKASTLHFGQQAWLRYIRRPLRRKGEPLRLQSHKWSSPDQRSRFACWINLLLVTAAETLLRGQWDVWRFQSRGYSTSWGRYCIAAGYIRPSELLAWCIAYKSHRCSRIVVLILLTALTWRYRVLCTWACANVPRSEFDNARHDIFNCFHCDLCSIHGKW